MKHYFMPRSDLDWGTVVIRSPLAGTIAAMLGETTFGTQIRITSPLTCDGETFQGAGTLPNWVELP